ncbi:GntR family transcriptional regulator [Puniceicoccaceae bacterium K14]|nr:GntR family transcriptional regulator [Puniceicoccaceae bacterium K14]
MSSSKPTYLQIFDEVKKNIRNRNLSPGDMLPTDNELAERYGVSRPTVAKALGLLSKEKLIIRRPGFGTQVLAPGKSDLTVGLLMPHMHETEIFEPICSSITETANLDGMQIVHPSELNLRNDSRAIAEALTQKFIDLKVHGVFFTPVEHLDDHQEEFNLSILERLHEAGIRVVLIDRDVYPWPRRTPYDLIGIDNIEAGYVMTNHLIQNGCRNLAFVTEGNPAMTVQQRIIGSREAHVQNGLRARDLSMMECDLRAQEQVAKQLIESKIDGVMCANDATAAPLLRALLNLGVEIPKDMKVCGIDDVKYASLLSIPLSSYHQPCKDLGKIAAKTMMDRILSPDRPPHRVTLSGDIMVRSSSCIEESR